MNLKCHFSALEPTLLSIENKLIIFDLTIFNCGISIISFLINLKTSPFLSQKPIFLLVFIRFHPIQFSRKPLYMRELDNIYLLTFNNNKQTKQREMNILPKIVMALFGISALLDIAEKINKLWGGDKKKDEKEKKEEPSTSRV